ncbi:MAG: hypothetical protein K6U03_09780 [Firmicutes bacterium]|nr:hypothetical protein [Bacillota bacterium]
MGTDVEEDEGSRLGHHLDGEGRPGEYQERLLVYGRAGGACPSCGAEIRRMVLAGRGTHYCPICQA